MNYYNIPADFKKETIDRCFELNKNHNSSKIIETYGNLTVGNFFGSGRSHSQLPKVDINLLKDYVNYSKSKDIDFNYTLNMLHMSNKEFTAKGVREINGFLGQLYQIGITNLTVALPSLIELIRSTKYDFKIKASAICSIDNANKALAFKKMGLDKIVIKEATNRDFATLKRIRDVFGEKVELIVNSPCHNDCWYRMSHYSQQASDSIDSTNEISFNYYEHRCMYRRYDDFSNWLKICWIRPEDIKYYNEIGVNYFKIQGRQSFIRGGDCVKVAEHYFNESFDGNLIDIINCFSKLNSFKVYLDNKKLEEYLVPFVKNAGFCKGACQVCKYCEQFANKILDIKSTEEINHLAKEFYVGFDKFNQLINSETNNLVRLKFNIEDKEDFDF